MSPLFFFAVAVAVDGVGDGDGKQDDGKVGEGGGEAMSMQPGGRVAVKMAAGLHALLDGKSIIFAYDNSSQSMAGSVEC